MKPQERTLVQDKLNGYLKSNLLKDSEVKEIKSRYEGKMRLDYGYNAQKNLTDYTPKQEEFYQYYYTKAAANNQKIKSMKQKIMENVDQGNPAYTQEVLDEMNAVWNEQKELYEHFLKEMERYQETLSDEEKNRMQEVIDTFGIGS